MIYLIGSMRNARVIEIANQLEQAIGEECFCEWAAVGPDADDYLREHFRARNPAATIRDMIKSRVAVNAFDFDKRHIDAARAVVMVYPAGRSAHTELGYARGIGKPAFVLYDQEPDRVEIMLNFASGIAYTLPELVEMINETH